DSLEKVYESSERLIQLVENLLNISRIESGRLQFDYEVMNLEKIVNSVIEDLSNTIKKKKLKLIYNKPAKPLTRVKIDEEKIRQVVLNLIDNAIKYTKKGNITINLSKVKSGIQFCIVDSGMGIRPEDLSNLFKKFSRGKGTSTIHTEGTGLGLYVAKQMVEAHQGKIWAESAGEGKGSKFCFVLPIK
ncbi:MAG: HAMP domain-containing sensor histidine kinase, partial [Patescibacteria group bacterium]